MGWAEGSAFPHPPSCQPSLAFVARHPQPYLRANLALALAPGDVLFLMAAAGQIPVGAATKEANAPTVFAVDEGPALIELDGTSACRINLVAGEYF